jgi:hypothetical protein
MRVRLLVFAIVGTMAPATAAASPHWAIQPTPNPAGASNSVLAGVSCASTRDCLAVGHFTDRAGAGAPLAERWDGARWSIERVARPAGARTSVLFEVSCASRSTCVAVGSSTGRTGVTVPLAERWDGRRWSTLRTRAGGTSVSYLAGVSCPSSSNCVAVGYVGNAAGTAGVPLAERWVGGSWVVQRAPRPSAAAVAFLSGVSCTSMRSCVAVGFSVGAEHIGRPLAERWDGHRWSIERTPSPQAATEVQLAGVSCALHGQCMAAGFFGIVTGIQIMLAEQRSGASWSIERTLYPRGARGVQFAGVSCASPRSCAAVGSFVDVAGLDEALVERWNGIGWAIQPTPPRAGAMSSSLSSVSCATSRTCTAVGSSLTSGGTELTLTERYS